MTLADALAAYDAARSSRQAVCTRYCEFPMGDGKCSACYIEDESHEALLRVVRESAQSLTEQGHLRGMSRLTKREMAVLVTAAEFLLCGEVDETLPDDKDSEALASASDKLKRRLASSGEQTP